MKRGVKSVQDLAILAGADGVEVGVEVGGVVVLGMASL